MFCLFLLSDQQGQSLLEVVVSAALIMVAIVALVSLSMFGLRASDYGLSKVRAIKLANEELELLRDYRNSISWESFKDLESSCDSQKCYVELDDFGVINIVDSGPEELADYYSRSEDYYSRSFALACSQTEERCRVAVLVSWDERGQTRKVTLNTIFTYW